MANFIGFDDYSEYDKMQPHDFESNGIEDKLIAIAESAQTCLPIHPAYRAPSYYDLKSSSKIEHNEIKELCHRLEMSLAIHGIQICVCSFYQTPISLLFGVEAAVGTRVNTIRQYKEDIALAMGGTVSFEIPLPGTSLIGIRIYRKTGGLMKIRSAFESRDYYNYNGSVPLVLGYTEQSDAFIEDLPEIGHLLIKDCHDQLMTTLLNTILLGIICKCSPNEVKLALINRTSTYFSIYNNIPHMFLDIAYDENRTNSILQYLSKEVGNRLEHMRALCSKSIKEYNEKIDEQLLHGEKCTSENEYMTKMPHLLVIIDELAFISSQEALDSLESIILRGKSAGVYVIVGARRLDLRYKYNRVTDYINYSINGDIQEDNVEPYFNRIQDKVCPGYRVVSFNKAGGTNNSVELFVYDIEPDEPLAVIQQIAIERVIKQPTNQLLREIDRSKYYEDDLLIDAAKYVIEIDRASIGNLQRKFRIGFNRAARILDTLADMGVVTPESGTRMRQVLMNMDEFTDLISKHR